MKKRPESWVSRIIRELPAIERDIKEYGLSEVARDRGCAPSSFWGYVDRARAHVERGTVPQVGRPKGSRNIMQPRAADDAMAPVQVGPHQAAIVPRKRFMPSWATEGKGFIEDDPDL
jgi:hypothetical protein